MRISPADLQAQFVRATRDWPFITDLNDQHGFPPCLLHAVGSRETNLRNVVGDGGHGHGVFQLDDRWHQIPPGFDGDVRTQTDTAARMLATLYQQWGDWTKALNCYNSGQPNTSGTANGDYGPDVLERRSCLAGATPPDPGPGLIPYMNYGDRSDEVARLQAFTNRVYPAYSQLPVTGFYGPLTAAVIKEFQRRVGIVGADGLNVGPLTAAKLYEAGFRG